MYRLIDYGWMLADRRRIEAYSLALAAVVRPSSVVVDLGTGIGTFALLAARLGASVQAIERDAILLVAEEIAQANQLGDRIRFIRGESSEITLDVLADVLVSDLSGALPLFERHIPDVIDARNRFLRRSGVLIPARDRLLCAPLSSADSYSRITSRWNMLRGIDLGVAAAMALNSPHPLRVDAQQIAAEPRCFGLLDYTTVESPDVEAELEWLFESASTIHGVALWFERTLHGDITYSSGPWSPESIHATMVLPLIRPLEVPEGGTLRLTLQARLIEERYVWVWSAETGEEAPVRQSSFLAQPIDRSRIIPPAEEGSPAEGCPAGPFRIAAEILERRVQDGLLLLDLASGMHHHLNEAGEQVWNLARSGHDTNRIVDAIASEYDVDRTTAQGDVAAAIARMVAEGLLLPGGVPGERARDRSVTGAGGAPDLSSRHT